MEIKYHGQEKYPHIVDGRSLHKALNVNSGFPRWITRAKAHKNHIKTSIRAFSDHNNIQQADITINEAIRLTIESNAGEVEESQVYNSLAQKKAETTPKPKKDYSLAILIAIIITFAIIAYLLK